jgi:predicted Zn-dependent protease
MDTTPYKWKIKIIESDDVNAFALPGGYVFINSGLIKNSDTPEEVAGVLAHEFTHVQKRHGLKNVMLNMGLQIFIYAIAGSSDAAVRFLIGNASQLAAMSFSREQENEADEGGVHILEKAGISPAGLEMFMKKMRKQENSIPGALTFLSTHPSSDSRMKKIRMLTRKSKNLKTDLKISNWNNLKLMCTPLKIEDPD